MPTTKAKSKSDTDPAYTLEGAADQGFLGHRPDGAPERVHFTAPPGGDTAPSTADEPTGTDPKTGLPAKSSAAAGDTASSSSSSSSASGSGGGA